MACFLVPTTEAIVTTAITKVIESKESKGEASGSKEAVSRFSRKMKWLNGMLWGGSALLAFEHLWHGEISPFFPFLTAASDPESTGEMLHEMATSGVAMAIAVTAVWGIMVLVSSKVEKAAAVPATAKTVKEVSK